MTSGARTGSSEEDERDRTATSGAAPTATDVREAPISRTPSVKRICEPPGASSPASRNGQT